MRRMELWFGILCRVGRDQRQIERVGEVGELGLGGLLDRIVPARQLDIQPIPEQRLQAPGICARLVGLTVGEKPRDRALRSGGQANQAIAGSA